MSTPVTEKAVEKTEEKKMLSLTDISQLGRLEKTKEVLSGVKVTLQTLPASHQQKVLAAIPPESLDPLGKFTYMQIETLTYATIGINDKRYDDADRAELKAFYSGLQNRVLHEFYAFYMELVQDQNLVIDSLKKT